MHIDVIILLTLCLFPSVYTLLKVKNRQELNAVDIFLLFATLYYILIPIKCVWGDVFYRDEKVVSILNNSGMTLVYICIAFYELLLCNVVISKSRFDKFRCLKITENFKIVNEEIDNTPATIYIYIIAFIYIIISITNYAALTDDVEGDRMWQYALNSSFMERCAISFANVGFPVFFVLTLRSFFKNIDNRYKVLKMIALILGILCIILGSKTNMMLVFSISIIYIYSCYREKLNNKMLFFIAGAMIAIPIVVFPMSQQFRMVKNISVESRMSHTFFDVASKFFHLDAVEKKQLMDKAKYGMDGRSMNVFVAFNSSVNNIYNSTDGEQLWDNLLAINPLHKPNPALSNINAIKLEGGGDIGESLFTIMNVDLGLWGIIVAAPLIFVIMSFMITFECFCVAHFFYVKELMLLPITYIIRYCVSIEGGIGIRTIYNPTLIGILMIGIVFSFFKKKADFYD